MTESKDFFLSCVVLFVPCKSCFLGSLLNKFATQFQHNDHGIAKHLCRVHM